MILEAAALALALMGEPSKTQIVNTTQPTKIIVAGLKDTKDGCPLGQEVGHSSVSGPGGHSAVRARLHQAPRMTEHGPSHRRCPPKAMIAQRSVSIDA